MSTQYEMLEDEVQRLKNFEKWLTKQVELSRQALEYAKDFGVTYQIARADATLLILEDAQRELNR